MKYPVTAERIKRALERKGMIAQELADRSGVKKSSISQYINGSHMPSNTSAGKMAEVLEVNPAWLMGFDLPMEISEEPTENYYLNKDARDLAEFLHKNPKYKVLFDASRKVKPEDIDFVRQMIDRMGNYDE